MTMRVTIQASALCLMLGLALAAPFAHAAGLDEVRAGNAAFAKGQYEVAVQAFGRGIQSGDLDPAALALALNNRGVAYNELGDYDAAIADYQQALKLRAGDATTLKNLRIAYIGRGGAAANLGETEAALADYTKAIQLDPRHPMALLRRGQLQLNQGNVKQALGDLEAARALDPQDPNVQALLRLAQAAAISTPPQTTALATPPPGLPPAPPASESPTSQAPISQARAPQAPPSQLPPFPTAPARVGEPAAGPATGTQRQPLPELAAPPVAARVPDPGGEGVTYRATADVNVRSGAGNDYPANASLTAGTLVQVLNERLGWMQVRLPDGTVGFVYRKWLVTVEPAQP